MKWYLQNPTRIYLVWWLVRLGILHKSCACTTLQPHSVGDLWVEQQQWSFLLSSLLKWIVLFRNHAPVKDCYRSNHPTCLSVLDDHCAGIQLARKLTYSLYWDDLPSVSATQCLERRYNSQCRSHIVWGLFVVNAVMTKETFSSLLTMFNRRCAPLLCGIWYIYLGL